MADSVFTYGGAKGGLGTESLASVDPEVADLVQHEMARQWTGLELIASENFTSQAVMEACGSAFTNKYSEGLPGARYYGGNEHVDVLERLAQSRALEAFGLTADKWGVNVQPYSGSPANFEVYTGLLQPHDRMMGLGLPSGGHLTHGYYTAKKKISASSIYFETLPYKVDSETGLLDYDEMERQALIFNPKIIIGGASAYPRDWDFKRMREICDKVGAMLMVDMAHVSGLVAAGEHSSPFEYADIVTTTTHKSLRGPRSGIIFFRRGDKPVKHDKAGNALPVEKYDYEERINAAVFPALQGGPHNHIIAGVAVCLKAAQGDEFKAYAKQVRANAVALAEALKKRGYKIVTDGTDNHLVLWDLRPQGITGSKMETVLERAHISVNKNSVHGDKSALSPSGVRLGTPALTSRGFKEADMDKIAELLHRGVEIAADVQKTAGKMLKVFIPALDDNEALKKLREDTIAFSKGFEMYGFHTDALKHQ